MVATRQQCNLEIAEILEGISIGNLRVSISKEGDSMNFSEFFKVLSLKYPQQRAGQIITNYICRDYLSIDPSEETKLIFDKMFPGNLDPFYEESTITLKRLQDEYSKKN